MGKGERWSRRLGTDEDAGVDLCALVGVVMIAANGRKCSSWLYAVWLYVVRYITGLSCAVL